MNVESIVNYKSKASNEERESINRMLAVERTNTQQYIKADIPNEPILYDGKVLPVAVPVYSRLELLTGGYRNE